MPVLVVLIRLIAKGIAKLFDALFAEEAARKTEEERARRAHRAHETAVLLSGVSDAHALGMLAVSDPDPDVRAAATERIVDRETLLAVSMRDEDPQVALMAVKKIALNEEEAMLLFSTAKCTGVKAVALARIEDQGFLWGVLYEPSKTSSTPLGTGSTHLDFRRIAAKAISDPSAVNVMLRDTDPHIRALAATKATNIDELRSVALTDPDVSVRQSVITNLRCAPTLERILTSDKDPTTRVLAAARLAEIRESQA